MGKIRTYSGYCPTLDDEAYICVEYAVINVIGRLTPGHKRTSYECRYAQDNGCEYYYKDTCPIFQKAPVSF